MANLKKLCDLADLPDGRPTMRQIGKKKFLVVRSGDHVAVCGNRCPHYGDPLSDGVVQGTQIICPSHYARFDLTSGQVESAPALDDLQTFETAVENGEVLVGRARPLTFDVSTPDGSDDRQFVIVGGGAAGNAAAESLRRRGFQGRIVIVTADSDLPYDRPELSKGLLTGEADPDWLPLRGPEFYQGVGIEVRLDTRAVSLDPEKRQLGLDRGDALSYDRLLIATGGRPRRLAIPGSEKALVLRTQADGLALQNAVQQAREVVILGAGFVGLEVASSLRSLGVGVTVVAPEDVPLAGLYGEPLGKRITEMHRARGTRFLLGRRATEIRDEGRSKMVLLSDGTRLTADVILMGVGIEMDTDWLDGSDVSADGVISVTETLATGAPDVFAAGDIASINAAGEARRVEHWAVAQNQGRHAAGSMLGEGKPYQEVPFFWSIQCDSVIKYVGWGGDRVDDVVYRGATEDAGFLAGYYSQGRLLAAASLNQSWDMIALEALIKQGADVSPEILADPNRSLLELAGARSGEE